MKYYCIIFIVITYYSLSIKVNPSFKNIKIDIVNNYEYQNIVLRDLTNLLKQNILLSSVIEDNSIDSSNLISMGDNQYRSLCISHRDTNPSMHVSDNVGLYHCFSCGEAGDIISYVRKVKNTSYAETLKYCTNLLRKMDNEIRYCLDNEPRQVCISSVIKILENRAIYKNDTISKIKRIDDFSTLTPYPNRPSSSSSSIKKRVTFNTTILKTNISTTFTDDDGEVEEDYDNKSNNITKRNKRILLTLKLVSIYYTSRLLQDPSEEGSKVRMYLQSRYISPLTAMKFQLGFAPHPFHPTYASYIDNHNISQSIDHNNISIPENNIHNIYRFNKLHYGSDLESMNAQEKYRILNVRLLDWIINTTFKIIPQPPSQSASSSQINLKTIRGSSSSNTNNKHYNSTTSKAWVNISKLRLDMIDLIISGLVVDGSKYKKNNNNNVNTIMEVPIKETNFYERFRDRLMVPIRDINGTIIGFGGRVLPFSTSRSSSSVKGPYINKPLAKYINSPSTTVFKKSNVLFGIDLAHVSIKKLDAVVIVEGYFDVICMHELGITNVVAALGTSITTTQLIYASKLTKSGTVILLMDSDLAGQNAAERVKKKINKNKHIVPSLINLYSTSLLHANNYIIENMLQPRKEKIVEVLLNTTVSSISTTTTYSNDNQVKLIVNSSYAVNYTSLVSKIKDCSDVYTWFNRSIAIKIMNFVLNSRSLCIRVDEPNINCLIIDK